MVYPGPDGPLSGLRFEAHRIGLEDHVLLERLGMMEPGQRDALIADVFRGFDDWEDDPSAYRRTRRELLERITGSHPNSR